MNEFESGLVFDILKLIGVGGQADVYLLRLRRTGGLYAGKFPREVWDPLVREEFRCEARRQARIAGSHVVPIVAWNLDVERPFVVLEYMPQGSLADEIKEQGPFEVLAALAAAREIAVAIAQLHSARVIHRDLKPGNILRASDGSLKLNDLGLGATMTVANWVVAPGFLGTPMYAAPEQTRGLACPQSDVFALGVILHELLTGTARFDGRLLSRLLGNAAERVSVLIARMCAEQVEFRPTAAEAVGLLDEIIRTLKPTAASSKVTPSSRGKGSDSGGAGWLWGGAALVTLAMLASGGKTWDPSVGRYRGRDGRFT